MTHRPRLLLAAVMMFALLLGQAHGALAAPTTGKPAVDARFSSVAEYCADSEEIAFLKLINDYRAQNGLGALVAVQTAGAAADHHSIDMATNNYFSHTLSDGTAWTTNLTNHGYTNYGGYRGENIAAAYTSASSVLAAWKNSAMHNSTMLNSNFKAIGIGRAYNANSTYGWYWTTTFGGYVDGAAAVCGGAPAPTQTATALATPTKTPTTQPTATSTVAPQPTATKTPTPQPTATMTSTPQPTATNTQTPQPTATKTPTPLSMATNSPTPQPTATDTATPQPTATAVPVAFVAKMDGKATTRRGATTLSVNVTVKDANGQAVSRATVTIDLAAPDGTTQVLSATTNSRGQASWSVKASNGSGVYRANIDNVGAGSYVYDASRNMVNSVAITVA